ncbi:MAG: DedA family protein [Gammaproteobacteria bacterium]|nr:MAG: DedA family protein [Gammaproteobacteria bacterium]
MIAALNELIFQWLEDYREQALLLIPLIAFSEACVGIGLIVSGFILVAVASVLVTAEIATVAQILPVAFLGALLGDHVGFYFGRWLGPRFHQLRLAKRYQRSILQAENMIRKRGAWAILIGRFIPAIRSMVPAMLGISGFERTRYSMVDASACLLWAAGLGLIVTGTTSIF